MYRFTLTSSQTCYLLHRGNSKSVHRYSNSNYIIAVEGKKKKKKKKSKFDVLVTGCISRAIRGSHTDLPYLKRIPCGALARVAHRCLLNPRAGERARRERVEGGSGGREGAAGYDTQVNVHFIGEEAVRPRLAGSAGRIASTGRGLALDSWRRIEATRTRNALIKWHPSRVVSLSRERVLYADPTRANGWETVETEETRRTRAGPARSTMTMTG